MVALWFFFRFGRAVELPGMLPMQRGGPTSQPEHLFATTICARLCWLGLQCLPQPFSLGCAGWIALHGMTSGGRTIQPEEDLTNSGCPPGPILRDTHLHMHACASWMASGLPVAKLYARGWNTPRGFTVTHVSARLATLARRAIHVGTTAIALITAVCLMGTWPGCRRSV